MKRLIPFVVLFVCATVFLSCTQEILFRDPAFQGIKDGEFWLSTNTRVYSKIEENSPYIFIEAINGKETITLRVLADAKGGIRLIKSDFGTSNSKTASYSFKLDDTKTIDYTTGTNRGSGSVTITEYNKDNKTISGKFNFEAIKIDNDTLLFAKKVTVKNGEFYNVPVY